LRHDPNYRSRGGSVTPACTSLSLVSPSAAAGRSFLVHCIFFGWYKVMLLSGINYLVTQAGSENNSGHLHRDPSLVSPKQFLKVIGCLQINAHVVAAFWFLDKTILFSRNNTFKVRVCHEFCWSWRGRQLSRRVTGMTMI
jgi:hypothetical protein